MLFLFISIFVLIVIGLIVPKRLTRHEMYTISFVSIFLAQTSNLILGFKYNYYGFLDKGVDFAGVLSEIIINPLFAVLILNSYPENTSLKYKIVHILSWSLMGLIYEGLAVQYGLLYYNKWKLWYSALMYPIIIIILIWNLWLIRNKMEV